MSGQMELMWGEILSKNHLESNVEGARWDIVSLDKLLTFGNGKVKPSSVGDIPIYGGNGILGHSSKHNYVGETIVIGRVGAYCGAVYFEKRPIWISDNALSAKPKGENDAEFLYYFLKLQNLNQYAGGSSHPLVTHTLLNSLEFEVCTEPKEQRAIARVLRSLDDKIDLLHRQNVTLESLAETLFRQWFVEEAKEEWKEGTVGDLVEFTYGKALKDQDRTGTGYPVYGSSGVVGYHSEYLVKGPGITTGRKGTLGVVSYSFCSFFPIDTAFYIKTKIGSEGLFFDYFLLKSLKLEDCNTDSAVPGLNRNLAHAMQISIPPIEKIKAFNGQVELYFRKIETNKAQLETLTNLRDTLLPKLMSGEVRVAY